MSFSFMSNMPSEEPILNPHSNPSESPSDESSISLFTSNIPLKYNFSVLLSVHNDSPSDDELSRLLSYFTSLIPPDNP